ncbi:TolC family outer membrane protein [Desulfomicrobium escambiense]|uniref:TolC family outer membrane protein n=1 Tax=Desulfomicrobium escambiense TaxID=29503 RepID=UPI00247FE4FB|nr:TolC family outer membrane protein [Desulfomicrobium escambiense]
MLLTGAAAYAEDQITVQKSVIDTLRYAPRLEMIKQNRQAVGHDLEKSKGRWYPKIDVRGGYGADSFHDGISNNNNDRSEDWRERSELGGYLTQRLYDGGEASSQIRLDESRLESLQYRVFDNAESLALDAIIAALEVYRQRELLFLAEENVKAHKDILASLKEREKAGAGSVADVTQTQARMSMAQASLEKTHTNLRDALSEFQRLTGYLPGQIEMTPYPADKLPATLEDMTALAKASNPKISAGTQDVTSEQERVNVAKSNYHPYVYAELSSQYSDGVQDSEDWERTDAAMVRFNWNLFNGGSDVAATKAAKARKRQSQADLEDLTLAVEDETKVTWAQFNSAQKEVVEYNEAVKQNRATKEVYLEQFGVAQRSLLDVLDSENEVFQSSNQLVTSSVNEHIAAYKLMALSGSLIKNLGVDPELYKSAARNQEE